MSFNALSIAKLGLGFGALAVASIGLLSPTPVEAAIHGGGSSGRYSHYQEAPFNIQADDEEIVLILTLMVELL